MSLPIIAIVGRPNVGKSTLFNRFAGRRRALVEDTPGLTRDRLAEQVEVAGREILVVDTAGLDPDAEAGLPAAVQAQAREAVEEADAILFVVDGQHGLLPADSLLGQELRRTQCPLVVAVNKIDTVGHQDRTLEFHALGLEPVLGISAEHGRNCWETLEELVKRLPEGEGAPVARSPDSSLRVALIGRPNVGKSSLLNRLLGAERVVVSDVPGTTRDAVDVRLDTEHGPVTLVDTAGLRRPGRRQRTERGSALMALRAVERAQVAMVLVDAGEGLTDQDVHVAGLARDRGCAAALILNKWDQVPDEDSAKRLQDDIDRRLRFMADTPVLRVSALTGQRISKILPLARELGISAEKEIPTAELNRWLADAVARHEPAMAQRGSRRRPLKFFYATQISRRPPTFLLFCTDPRAVQPSYRRFLINRLREHFDLKGTAIRLRLRARSPKDSS